MDRIFGLESPIMVFMSRVADLLLLNIITLICCIPIFTIGASVTSLHYVTIKIVKGEDGYILRNFFKSFKENFKQSTILWLVYVVIGIVFYFDYMIISYSGLNIPSVLGIVVIAVFILIAITFMYIFPVLSRFENTIKNTVKNSFFMSILNLQWTFLLIIIYAIPVALLLTTTASWIFLFLFGASVASYIASYIWVRIFKKYEPKEEEETGEYKELSIFSEE
ncbi:MAG: YesL family protein [Lachnospiraceae bacterium]